MKINDNLNEVDMYTLHSMKNYSTIYKQWLNTSPYLVKMNNKSMVEISVFDKEAFLYIPLVISGEGKVSSYVISDTMIAKQTAAYYSMQSDLIELQEILKYLSENPKTPMIVRASMYKAFITQYARCFAKSDGRKLQLDARAVFKDKKDLLPTHKEVVNMRNNYMAHAGVGIYEYGAMIGHLNPDTSNPYRIGSIYAELKFLDHARKMDGYAEVCKCVLEFLRGKLDKLRDKFEKEFDETDLKVLYSKCKTPERKDWIITKSSRKL